MSRCGPYVLVSRSETAPEAVGLVVEQAVRLAGDQVDAVHVDRQLRIRSVTGTNRGRRYCLREAARTTTTSRLFAWQALSRDN
jgi:hypothetical protein